MVVHNNGTSVEATEALVDELVVARREKDDLAQRALDELFCDAQKLIKRARTHAEAASSEQEPRQEARRPAVRLKKPTCEPTVKLREYAEGVAAHIAAEKERLQRGREERSAKRAANAEKLQKEMQVCQVLHELGYLAVVTKPSAVRVGQLHAFVKDQGITTVPVGSGKAALFVALWEFVQESTRTHRTLQKASKPISEEKGH